MSGMTISITLLAKIYKFNLYKSLNVGTTDERLMLHSVWILSCQFRKQLNILWVQPGRNNDFSFSFYSLGRQADSAEMACPRTSAPASSVWRCRADISCFWWKAGPRVSRTHLDDHNSRRDEMERDRGGEIKKRGAEKHFHCSAQWSKLTLGCRQENLAFFIDCRLNRSPPISSNNKI